MLEDMLDEVLSIFPEAGSDKPLIQWYQAESDELSLVQESLAVVGIDENGDAWVSAEYGRDIAGVLAAAKASGEHVAYRNELPYVRVDWLLREFPECEAAFAEFGLRFA